MDQELNPNKNEVFPMDGTLGTPTEGASAKAMLLAVVAGLAALLITLQLGIVCRSIYITATGAEIEVTVTNWEPDTQILWKLFPEGIPREGVLLEKVTLLQLTGLDPDTWYELEFYLPGEAEPFDTYRFLTGPGEKTRPTEPSASSVPSSSQGTTIPSSSASGAPSAPESTVASVPTSAPSTAPSTVPATTVPTTIPTTAPTTIPTSAPTTVPTTIPTTIPTTAPTVPTTAPTTTPTAPTSVAPAARAPEMTDYTPPRMETETLGSYTVTFTFDLNDGQPTALVLSGTQYRYGEFDPYGPDPENPGTTQTAISQTFGPGQMQINQNTVQVSYTVPSAYTGCQLRATLHYQLDGGQDSVSTQSYSYIPTYLVGSETGSGNVISSTRRGDFVDVTIDFGDFHSGTLDFQLTMLDIWVSYDNGEVFPLSDYITPPEMPAVTGGKLRYSFTLPMADPKGSGEPAQAIYINLDASGDCYYDGQPMGLESRSYSHGRIVLGTAYRVEAPTVHFSDGFIRQLAAYGLEIESVQLSGGMPEQSMDQMLPGDTVYVDIRLKGTVTQDFTLTPNLTLAGDLADLYVSYTQFYQGEENPMIYFCFTMPARNVTAQDVVMEDFTFE